MFPYDSRLKLMLMPYSLDSSLNETISCFFVTYSGNYRQLEILLDSGLSIHSRESTGFSLLHCAAVQNQAEIATLLLERQASLKFNSPNTPT